MRYRTDEEMTAALLRCAALVDGPLTVPEFNRLRRRDEPSAAGIIKRHGSWPAALEQLGLPAATHRTRKWADDELDEALARWAATTDDRRFLTYRRLSAGDPTWPSETALRRRYGSWADVVAEASRTRGRSTT